MAKRVWIGLGATALVLVLAMAAWMPTAGAAQPRVAERVLFEDPEDHLHGAMDILALYASESFAYDVDKRELRGDVLHLRFELRAIGDLPQDVPVRFHVGYVLGGEARTAWADIMQPRCGSSGCDPPYAVASNVGAVVNPNGVILNLAYADHGLSVGTILEKVFAATGLPTDAGAVVWQDVAPHDDTSVPHGATEPTAPAGAATLLLNGPFPYVEVTPAGPLSMMSVDGEQVKYDFEVKAAEGVAGQIVYFLFDTSETWRVNPSHGESGPGAIGVLVNLGASPVRFSAGVVALSPPDRGATESTRMHVVSSSGAYHAFDMATTVTGPRIEDPAYTFGMTGPGTATVGSDTGFSFEVRRNGVPLVPPARISVDLYRNDRFVDSVPTKPAQAGVFDLSYAFDGHGTWRLEPFVASLRPSPTAAFEVDVQKGGLGSAPAPGAAVAVLAAVAAVGLWGRTRRESL